MTVASYSFTKLVVQDLEAMARYYRDVYGLDQHQRVTAEIDGAPIDEIILGIDGEYAGLILLTWVGQTPMPVGEVILGFTTPDIDALFARAEAAGATIREHPKESDAAPGMIVGFVADPEGHLAEVVQRRP
jgi:catechol 2,3-dioxygenase-like lactoylglutathione lyase family enzyme